MVNLQQYGIASWARTVIQIVLSLAGANKKSVKVHLPLSILFIASWLGTRARQSFQHQKQKNIDEKNLQLKKHIYQSRVHSI
jgi:hypothetical protein